ncbi:ABC transporter substrate-binding protein [Leucobacter luti]|uniref:Peptide/nickel transport system substrate-binding protein n=1 Tax=Leucobacter luti TaxID=340320 RepID=A0A4Q7TU91_9MICO|nr:ABC transporter substrate-binding protein [Leucobacter luti]RZT64526.1 peptide/nickel transport system substrate-binding protein [Leucobacter luti]
MPDPDTATHGVAAHTPRRRRPAGRLLAALFASVAVVACVAAFASGGPAAGQSAADDGGSDGTVRIGVILEPTSLDIRGNQGVATSQILTDNVYQGLIGVKAGTVDEIVPVLATELPRVSTDGRTATFTIRDGVTFHSGGALTADDVVASLAETLTPENVGFAPTIDRVDARTIRITLAERNSDLMWQLANTPGLIREAAADNDLEVTANGTGPYRFEAWDRGETLTLVRNADYWGAPATLDRAVFSFLPQGRAAVKALRGGDIDVHTALLPSLSPEFEGDAAYTLNRARSTDVFTLAFNSAKAPLNDPRVRTALSRAIDPDALIAAQNGNGTPLGSPVTELDPGFVDLTDVNAYDPQSARDLLYEAGQDHLTLTITMPDHYDPAPLDLLKGQLADVGVAIVVKQLPFSAWLEQVVRNHDYQVSYVDHAEPRGLADYAHPGTYFGYDSPRVQELYARALAEADPAAAAALFSEAAAQVAADAPAKWLVNYAPTNVLSTRIAEFPRENTNSRINLAGVRLN